MKVPSDSGFALVGRDIRSMVFCWIAISVVFASGLSAGSIFDDDWKEPTPSPKPTAPLGLPAPPQPSSSAAPQPKPAEPQPVPTAAPAASPDRRPVPPREDQARSRKLLKEVFATQLADRTPAGRLALAEKLLDEARKTQEVPSDHFVLLLGVIAAGRDAGDLVICTQAADMLASLFSVDGFRVKVETALKMSLKASPPAVASDNARDGLKLIDALIVRGDYATASRMIGIVRPAAASDHLMAQRIAARAGEIEVIRSTSEACVEEVRKLREAPMTRRPISRWDGFFVSFSVVGKVACRSLPEEVIRNSNRSRNASWPSLATLKP